MIESLLEHYVICMYDACVYRMYACVYKNTYVWYIHNLLMKSLIEGLLVYYVCMIHAYIECTHVWIELRMYDTYRIFWRKVWLKAYWCNTYAWYMRIHNLLMRSLIENLYWEYYVCLIHAYMDSSKEKFNWKFLEFYEERLFIEILRMYDTR